MGKQKRECDGWRNRKGMEGVGKHKGNRNDGETQREYNGWGNRKGIEWMGLRKGYPMDREGIELMKDTKKTENQW